MFNPFKYRPVSQEDNEDEDILYQGNNIPLSNLGEGNFGDEVEMELPRKSPTARRRSPLALCFVIVVSIIFISLLITLIVYIVTPSGYFNGQESNSTTGAQSAMQHIVTSSATISSSSTIVVVQVSVSSSALPAPTSTEYESTLTTVEVFNVQLQSTSSMYTTSTISDIVVNTVASAKTSVFSQTSEPKPSSSMSTFLSTATSPIWTTATVGSDVELLSSPTLTINLSLKERLNNTTSTSLVEPSVTASSTVNSNGTVYPLSHNQSTESAASMPNSMISVSLVEPSVTASSTVNSNGTVYPLSHNQSTESAASMLNSMISVSLVEPSVTANSTVSSSGIAYPLSHNQSTESAASMPNPTDLPVASNNTIHWHKMNLEVVSECTPFVIDVNSDGIDDIIFSYAAYTKDLNMYYCTSSVAYENACMKDAGYPVCGAIVVAVNGLNGEVIWLRNLTRPVFGIRCVMDVNDDGETDCFVIGRYHQWDTIDKATGNTIWEADKSIGYPGYNFYYPLPLEDFDGDDVVDILNIHGGDQSYGSEETNRSPALIVILSGKTGKKLIDPIVVPDGHESYMSPVWYTLGDKDAVLFGTGGETITGSLWAITVDSIKQYVESGHFISNNNDTEYIGCRSEFMADKDIFRPKYDETIYQLDTQNQQSSTDCPPFGQHLPITNKYKLCLYELYHSSSKGMIIPPVIIDMNSDNVQDLIIQSFGGHVLCLDGVDGRVLWDRHIPGSESYNIPAPLFYNDDDTPDLFLRVNIGEWDDYNYSYVVIIDGTDGKALWAMNSSYATMQSAVTLMSVNHSQDAVMFFAYNPIDTKDLNSTTVKRRQMDNASFHNESMPTNGSENANTFDEEDNGNDFDEGDTGEFNEDIKHLGEQFWNLSNASFPDPLVDPKGFIESCKFNPDQIEQQSYLYLITRDTVTGNDIHPIAAAFPGILIPGHGMISSHSIEKRHGGTEASLEILHFVNDNAWRCSYVQSPSTYTPVTPVIADLNHDGKLEVIYAFQFTSGNSYFSISYVHSVYDLHVQTIENMVQSDMIDLSQFLPMEKQSWTTYMGSKGDGIYNFDQE